MNNAASLNSTTINGWLGDATVRIQVIAFAQATGGLIARAWRRSSVAAEASVSPAEGRVWRRSPTEAQAIAESTLGVSFFRWIRLSTLADAYATAIVTAINKPRTNVRLIESVVASTSVVVTAKTWFRTTVAASALASALFSPKVFRREITTGDASAIGGIDNSVYRQLPWDEYALPEYTFVVTHEPNTFYVVS